MTARHVPGAALRQAIREEIERFWNEEVHDDPQIVTTLFACQACPKTFQTRGEALAHDIDVHFKERVSRLRPEMERKPWTK